MPGSPPAAALTARNLERLWAPPSPGGAWAAVCAAARSRLLVGAVEAFAVAIMGGACVMCARVCG